MGAFCSSLQADYSDHYQGKGGWSEHGVLRWSGQQ
ncbi:hypothetical protein DAI22_08g230800 [Oryza sativa Japonica Group]|nr:hypothetical protein DAI22_08g230800 [Oryza sativa Japonica Group]